MKPFGWLRWQDHLRPSEAAAITPLRVKDALAPASSGPDCLITTQDDLLALPQRVQCLLLDRFDIGASSERLCPVQYADQRVAVCVVEGWQDSDQVVELEQMMLAQGLIPGSPARLVMPAPLLLALVRGQILPTGHARHPRSASSPEARRSAMAAAFHDLVTWAFEHQASDIHLNVNLLAAESEVRFSVAGRYVAPARFSRMPTATLQEILAVAWMDIQGGNGAVFDPRIEQQGRLRLEVQRTPVMLRWASMATDSGPSVCLRILRLDAQADESLATLGYLPQHIDVLQRACAKQGGAIVVAGVVGSGKSTTIATLLSGLPASHKVITLENPVEYRIAGALQNTVSRSLADEDRGVFDAKLRTIKRSAMQDLLLGEIRDQETGRAFMDLAGSGVNVYTTVHAGSALLVADRLASDFIGVSRDFLASPGILKLLVYQALLPKLCRHCSRPAAGLDCQSLRQVARQCAERWQQAFQVDVGGLRFRHRSGCVHCQQQGLEELAGWCGRSVVAEMVEPADDDMFLQSLRDADMVTLRRHWRSQRREGFDHPDMQGKSARDCAIYKALGGELDPLEIESRFGIAAVGKAG